jgi:UDP-N-acetylmuramoyl-tripeptide--D-alanyl-D-alanine ligase
VPSFNPSSLASWTAGQWTSRPSEELHGFSQDSRKLQRGQIFIALRTPQRDGHDFVANAFTAGASGAIVSRRIEGAGPQLVVADPLKAFQTIAREHRRTFRGSVVGVTGSCGKTSTKNLLAQMLGGEPRVLATEGNLNNHIGVPLTLTRLDQTLHEAAVIEAGISGPGEMAELAEMIEPEYGIVTLVAPAHTAELGGIEGVAREKAVLLQHVRPSGLGVFPQQCWQFAPFRDLPQTSIVVVPAGESTNAPRSVSYRAEFTAEHTSLVLGKRRFQFRRVSRGMAQNAALGIVLASELGVGDSEIQRALENWQSAKWRGEILREGQRQFYLDFYNANPASMADALENFYGLAAAGQPRLLVLGGMEELGPDSAKYHRDLGRQLQLGAQDRVFVIGSEADMVKAGAAEHLGSAVAERVEVVSSLEKVTAAIAGFHGSIFMKGSRRYELERALPSGSLPSKTAEASRGSAGAGASSARTPQQPLFTC